MIPVEKKPEPENFDRDVRQKGKKWIEKRKLPTSGPPPEGTKFESYWTKVIAQLYEQYDGVCAYYSHYFHFDGAATVDHFIPQTKDIAQVYEWGNYRLACRNANSRKGGYTDVLDPFTMRPETFRLNLLNGKLSVNPEAGFDDRYVTLAESTIKRLKLNDPGVTQMRLKFIDECLTTNVTENHLLQNNPFVHFEMQRQNKLKPDNLSGSR